jgi:hypothetical protein
MKKVLLAIMFAGLSSLLTACGGGSSDNSSAPPTPAPSPSPTPLTNSYTVGGAVSGLNGSLTIKNNSTDQLIVTSTGSFTFATPVNEGGQYNVTITSQPSTQTCTLSNASGTNITANVSSISISCLDNPPGTTSLSLSTSTLALKTSGTPRIFIVTNTGQDPALSVNITTTPGLPTGTSQSTTCAASLAPGSSCSITITPGLNPSAAAPLAPNPSTLTISGSNTNSLNANVYVLTYGNIYQSGYIFSLDDLTPATSSVGGKVSSLVDNPTTSKWSPTTTNISSVSATATSPCNGANDGECDTEQILANFPPATTDYAAGLCKLSTSGGYTNWYLPAICEMNSSSVLICPAQDDIQSKLVNPSFAIYSGYYWSSTQALFNSGWGSQFGPGSGINSSSAKTNLHLSICARKLTN